VVINLSSITTVTCVRDRLLAKQLADLKSNNIISEVEEAGKGSDKNNNED
jgi:hypothetical protein